MPIALYGDTSYNKDTLRNLISTGSQLMPGSSTINFDRITKEKIFSAIDSANMQMKKDLESDYKLLKFKLGRIPMMKDFIEHGSRDPFSSVNYSKSYFIFLLNIEDELKGKLSKEQTDLLELFSGEINNGKRLEESYLHLLKEPSIKTEDFRTKFYQAYGFSISDETLHSIISNLNFEFIKKPKDIICTIGTNIELESAFRKYLKNKLFREFLEDSISYSVFNFNSKFKTIYLYSFYFTWNIFR